MILVRRQNQRLQAGVRLAGIGVAKLEHAPLRLAGNGVPAALFLQRLRDGGEADLLQLVHEGVVALLPHHEDHRRQRQRLFLDDRVGVELRLPILDEHVFVVRRCRRPDVDPLVALENCVRRFDRSQRDQIHLNPRALGRVREFTDRPLQPALLLRPVGDAEGHAIAARQRSRGGRRRRGPGAAGAARGAGAGAAAVAGTAAHQELVGPRRAGGDEQQDDEAAQAGQARAAIGRIVRVRRCRHAGSSAGHLRRTSTRL
jgi:hypothetical protein